MEAFHAQKPLIFRAFQTAFHAISLPHISSLTNAAQNSRSFGNFRVPFLSFTHFAAFARQQMVQKLFGIAL
jgi:hypothetical protein